MLEITILFYLRLIKLINKVINKKKESLIIKLSRLKKRKYQRLKIFSYQKKIITL